jgi:capsular exopolysaccharide synthesis family protein
VLREVLDTRIRNDDAAEAIAGARVLGHIPHNVDAAIRPLVVVDVPDSPEAEAYRRLRTNLRVVTIDQDHRSLLVTSAASGEGKTLVAANLGFAFAQAGHRVTLVDADLRRPRLAQLLDLEPAPGLSELLSGDESVETVHEESQLPLEVLTAGSRPPNPSELLESDRFGALLDRLTGRSEIVIIDSPALLPVSDAAVIARMTAAVLMVARVPSTRAEALDAAAESLRAVGKQPVGAVLNGVRTRAGRDYVYGPSAAGGAPAGAVPAWDS